MKKIFAFLFILLLFGALGLCAYGIFAKDWFGWFPTEIISPTYEQLAEENGTLRTENDAVNQENADFRNMVSELEEVINKYESEIFGRLLYKLEPSNSVWETFETNPSGVYQYALSLSRDKMYIACPELGFRSDALPVNGTFSMSTGTQPINGVYEVRVLTSTNGLTTPYFFMSDISFPLNHVGKSYELFLECTISRRTMATAAYDYLPALVSLGYYSPLGLVID